MIAEGGQLALDGEAVGQVPDVVAGQQPAAEVHGLKGAGEVLAAAAEDVVGLVVHGVALEEPSLWAGMPKKSFSVKSNSESEAGAAPR